MSDSVVKFNLSPLLTPDHGIAVWCPDKDLAVQFVAAARKEYPDFFTFWLNYEPETKCEHWEKYKEETCYCPNLNKFDGVDYFQFGGKDWFVDHKYQVIHINDLIECTDLGEIEEVDVNIMTFFV